MLRKNIKILLRVFLGLLISFALASPLSARGGGGGGGHGGGGHGGGGFSGGSFSSGGRAFGGGHTESGNFSARGSFRDGHAGSFDSGRFSGGHIERSGGAGNFGGSERFGNHSSFSSRSFSAENQRDSSSHFANSHWGSVRANTDSRVTSAPRSFTRNLNTVESRSFSRESIAPPLSQTLRNSRSTQFAGNDSAWRHSSDRMGFVTRIGSGGGRSHSFATGGGQTWGHSANTNWHQSGAWNGNNWRGNSHGSNRQNRWNNNWRDGNWNNGWHNDWHGDVWGRHHHHHGDFDDNIFVFFGFGSLWPYWYPWYGYPWCGYWSPWYGYGYCGYGYDGYGYYGYYGDYPMSGNTYNYYNYDNTGALEPGSTVNGIQVPDYGALSQVGKGTQTGTQNKSDKLFDEGVQAFGNKDYKTAISKFAAATQLEPKDTVLPFTYAQALFANGQYQQSATVIEKALSSQSQQPEVFYPRGMYKDENVLNSQIADLSSAVANDPQNAHLQLLYGYQLMGIGNIDGAMMELELAKSNPQTRAAANALTEIMMQANQPSPNTN